MYNLTIYSAAANFQSSIFNFQSSIVKRHHADAMKT